MQFVILILAKASINNVIDGHMVFALISLFSTVQGKVSNFSQEYKAKLMLCYLSYNYLFHEIQTHMSGTNDRFSFNNDQALMYSK